MMDKKHCLGCRQDFYNDKNPMGIKECWSLATAKRIMRKAVHINQQPPWMQKAELYPSCYDKPQHIFVKPGVIR